VPKAARVLDLVTGGRPAVGLRVPSQPLALELLAAFGGGIAAPSANRFGRVSPTTAAHVRADLGADVDLVLDGGPCTVGVESTIVDLTAGAPTVLRPGHVTASALEEVLGTAVAFGTGPSRAPGMLPSHYAPACRIELAEDRGAAEHRAGELREEGVAADVLAPDVDADGYAHHFYEWLRAADERGLDVLVVVPPPAVGVGLAVRDRLAKAAAPRAGEERG
jgi:L-threonylcarbamoyladenylate synthase